ncbi:MAG: hypothetical protein PVSMB7_23140 [Chloroflexota bacterium]
MAERVFGTLRSPYERIESDDGDVVYEASGLGFHGTLFSNGGDAADPEFEAYHYGLEITSQFWCVELDTQDLEGPLSEYYAREIAFELDMETATEILLETTEESEIFEIRSYRRNPQYRLDLPPTVPKVFLVESRQVEEAFEDDAEWEEDEDETAGVEEADARQAATDLEREDR